MATRPPPPRGPSPRRRSRPIIAPASRLFPFAWLLRRLLGSSEGNPPACPAHRPPTPPLRVARGATREPSSPDPRPPRPDQRTRYPKSGIDIRLRGRAGEDSAPRRLFPATGSNVCATAAAHRATIASILLSLTACTSILHDLLKYWQNTQLCSCWSCALHTPAHRSPV
jgi:hypothetical protein